MQKISTSARLIKQTTLIIITGILFLNTRYCNAQLSPFQSSYFQNRYLADPSMAGYEAGLNVNLGYRQQWATFPGAPKTQTLTADYRSGDKVGLGLNISNDQAGLIERTRIAGTYAYHIPLGGAGQKLNLGLSFGVNDPHVNNGVVNGDQTDVQIADYNQLKAYIDGDLGVSYTSRHLILEGVLPDLKTMFFGDQDTRIDVDRTTFMAAVSYKLLGPDAASNVTIEPKLALRGVKGFDDILDAGVNFTLNNAGINFSGIYHSNHALGLGVAFMQKHFDLALGYNVETGNISTYTAGALELGIKMKLFK